MYEKTTKVKVNNIEISNNNPFTLIAGPCVLESKEHAFFMVEKILEIVKKLNINFIYKSSFDKANRSSLSSQRGMGLEKSLEVFAELKKKYNVAVMTDVHESYQCKEVAEVVDVLQIPAFLCRQTDLLKAAAETSKVLNIKKGQFLAPWDMANVVKKVEQFGNKNIMLCERGASFGYNTLVSDMRAIPIMAKTTYPIIFDATHSVQQPGGLGLTSGGQREFAPILARAAISIGVAGLFIETHQDPDNAPSDGPNMIKLNELEDVLLKLQEFDNLAKRL